MGEQRPLLEVSHLQVSFPADAGHISVIHDVSFHVNKGEIVALVGESGSGKSVTALSVMRLHGAGIRYGADSSIRFHEQELLDLPNKVMQDIRGNQISMIFQDPMVSLNPVHKIKKQIMEPILLHQKKSKQEALGAAKQLLEQVGISDPEKRLDEYPHQLSGGMRQRVMIAMALACKPSLLIADEPTTALDVTIQAQVLQIMKQQQEQTGVSILLITHDLGVVAEMADRVLVMYAGRIVEEGDVAAIFERPLHPYTRALLQSVPKLDGKNERLASIPGTVPSPFDLPQGCPFHARCFYATDPCKAEFPAISKHTNQSAACWNPLNREESYV
ncbi:ABC transporter ATP-binding protein [Effusibacillus dendaii]|uniref:ABC transporter ATP-binding protein n=1 Tax=Effusibacillus dendaii TaxID=2743772 RepID=A0A7I8DAG7_9BACL|nr:ABC transporter ATP-binding protein [Effusibacillus dendaii]BCJ85520.1 ABC transporter ATP-binding protein [Effusibacillus dendaii]